MSGWHDLPLTPADRVALGRLAIDLDCEHEPLELHELLERVTRPGAQVKAVSEQDVVAELRAEIEDLKDAERNARDGMDDAEIERDEWVGVATRLAVKLGYDASQMWGSQTARSKLEDWIENHQTLAEQGAALLRPLNAKAPCLGDRDVVTDLATALDDQMPALAEALRGVLR